MWIRYSPLQELTFRLRRQRAKLDGTDWLDGDYDAMTGVKTLRPMHPDDIAARNKWIEDHPNLLWKTERKQYIKTKSLLSKLFSK